MELEVSFDSVRIPYAQKQEERYIWRPLRGEASFLFPPVKKEKEVLVYNVQGLCPLERWINMDRMPADILFIIQKLLKAREYLQDYLIEEERISWKPAQVYWNESQQEVVFLYLPLKEEKGFFDFLKDWGREMIKRAVEEEWQNEKLLLFILYFCQKVQKQEGLKNLECFVENELEKETGLAEEVQRNTTKKQKRHSLFLPRRRECGMINGN